jgi:hypothetical protein
MISDEALMLEFQSGSREVFEELFARYREPLYGFFQPIAAFRAPRKSAPDGDACRRPGKFPRSIPPSAGR